MRLIIFCLFFWGCSSPSITHFQGVAHTHSYHIQVGGTLFPYEKKEIQKLIDMVFEEVDHHYNRWNPHSELSSLNQGTLVSPLSPQLERVLHLAQSYKDLSKGYFDPSLGGVIAHWKAALKRGELPQNNGSLIQEIDLDGMLKGHAVDLIVERLHAAGYKNLCVEWGGDIRASGHHPSKRDWRILMNDQLIHLDGAIATSGNDIQQWEVEGKVFTHIINPKTARALEVTHIRNVTVRAPSCSLADALATACMTIENDNDALEWAEGIKKQIDGVNFWIVTKQ